MLFSSVPFLFYFLPAALLIYFAATAAAENAVLLLASLFFYAWGEPKYMLLMLVSIVQGYGFGLLIEKHRGQKASKVFLTLSILVSLGLLGYFKYADFFLSSVNAVTGLSLPLLKLSLPIGISFYTFQVLSYVIDVYRGETAAQRNFIDLAAYVSLFPQTHRGADRTVFRRRRRAQKPHAQRLRRGGGRAPLHGRLCQENSARQPVRRARERLQVDAGRERPLRLALRARVSAPSLFRLFGLQRYGHRPRADAGLPLP